ncbi:hypothetical protein EG829_19325, partial [bacterium]|nr:hypothetical protein [bacterium]
MREDLLEFSTLKGYIRSFVASEMGYTALGMLRTFETWDEVQARWSLLREMMDLVIAGEAPVFSAVSDIRELLDIPEGAMLEGKDIVMVSGVVTDTTRIKRSLERSGGELCSLTDGIVPLDSLTTEIGDMLTPMGEISEDANPFLRKLRKRSRMLRTAILEKLQLILDGLQTNAVVMDNLITVRNDRFVIPLRHDYGNQVKGITHDYSRSDKTAYVEPLSLVEDNNELNQVRSDIKEEESKILRELTNRISEHAEAIRQNLSVYGTLDLLHACALWAVKH